MRQMRLGMSRLVILVALAMALAFALPDTTEATFLTEIKKLDLPDRLFLGRNVAVNGDTAVVGTNVGASAIVFQRDEGGAGNWGQVKKLIPSPTQVNDRFGVSALSGDTVIVGASRADAGASQAGAAYIFHRDQGGMGNWGQVKRLVASDGQVDDRFGSSVAASADTAVVGAWGEDAGGSGAGAAYVFERDEGGTDNWGEVTKLTASDAEDADFFGYSVSVSGETAVVGARLEDSGGSQAGAIYVFQRDEGGPNTWGEVKKLTASDAQVGNYFGNSVAVSGDTVLVGATGEQSGVYSAGAGAAYIFQRDAGGADNWGEVKRLTASNAEADDRFGVSVAIGDDTLVVGASKEGVGGAAYEFQRNEGGAGNWGEVTKLTASDSEDADFFGGSVAVSGDTAIVGAPNAARGTNRGAAYVFDLLLNKPPTPTPTPCPSEGCPVGGIALDSDLRSLPLEAANPDRSYWSLAFALVVACLLAVAGAALWARRRIANR